jgi:hypothetical protein
MGACRSTIERNTPRFRRLRVREERLDRVQPRAGGRREVEHPARVAGEPGPDVGVFVAGVVVEDHVDHL